jgi:acetyl esterase/lipase
MTPTSDNAREDRHRGVPRRGAVALALGFVAYGVGVGNLNAQGASLAKVLSLPVGPPEERLSYGSDPLQFGELRLPQGNGPFPLAIIVHGGCWSAKLGGLPEEAVSLALVRPFAASLTDAGVATWNVEYRRLGNAGGGWPGTYQDLARATDFAKELASRYRLDLARVITIGHSSGGHLAMWLAARKNLPKTSLLYVPSPLPLVGVVSLDGLLDLVSDLAAQVCGFPAVTEFMGGSPRDHPDRYAQGSASTLRPLGVPQALFASPVFEEAAKSYQASGKHAGEAVDLRLRPDAGHFGWLDPSSQASKAVIERIQSLVAASKPQ